MPHKIVPKNALLIPDEAKRVFEGVIYDVYHWQQELYDGSKATFERLRRPDTVIFAGIKDGQILLVEEEQPGRQPYLSLPGGRVDPGESWEHAVKRECLEEAGLEFKNWRLINVVQPVTKIEWFVAIYLATDITKQTKPRHDAGEKISIKQLPFAQAKQDLLGNEDPLIAPCFRFLADVSNLQQLQELPEFKGQTIKR